MQLKHEPKETSWEDLEVHGYVTIKDAEGTVLVSLPGMQHNRKLSALRSGEVLTQIKEAVGSADGDDASTKAESEEAIGEA